MGPALGDPGAAAGPPGGRRRRPRTPFPADGRWTRYPAGGVSATAVQEIRRVKARVDAERLPRGADPNTHTKLGRGGLADVEWTVQLLQLRHAHQVPALHNTSTLQALDAIGEAELIDRDDVELLREAWLTATRARNALVLVRGKADRSAARPRPPAQRGRRRGRLAQRRRRRVPGQLSAGDPAGESRRTQGIRRLSGLRFRPHRHRGLRAHSRTARAAGARRAPAHRREHPHRRRRRGHPAGPRGHRRRQPDAGGDAQRAAQDGAARRDRRPGRLGESRCGTPQSDRAGDHHPSRGDRLASEFTLGPVYEGPPGLVHGGICALLLDQLLGEVATNQMSLPKFTGTISLRYLRGTPLGPLRAEAWVERTEGHKTYARGFPPTRRDRPWKQKGCSSCRLGRAMAGRAKRLGVAAG